MLSSLNLISHQQQSFREVCLLKKTELWSTALEKQLNDL